MRLEGLVRLYTALAAYAQHDRVGYHGSESQAVERLYAMRRPVVDRINSASPIEARRGHIDANDLVHLVYMNGATPASWIELTTNEHANIQAGTSTLDEAHRMRLANSYDHYRALFASTEPIAGPVLLGIQQKTEGPVVVYDGVHRIAAWSAMHCPYPLGAFVLMTANPP